jgi:hypothetical protein
MDQTTQRLVMDAPALTSRSWLPTNSGITWLDDLGTEHRRLLAGREAADSERSALAQRFEREDDDRRQAYTASARSGHEPDVASPTAPDERRALLADAEARVAAANDALDGFLTDAIATIEERASDALDDLAERLDDAAEKRREAQRLVAEADAVESRTWRLDEWMRRNAGVHPRPAFKRVPAFRFAGWDLVETLNRPQGVTHGS